ncbi:MAG: hypothetical protein HKN47_02210 [Pirellulaceae bacterium]|nr:hypothetical protein [Pirellulaceae bacterium]
MRSVNEIWYLASRRVRRIANAALAMLMKSAVTSSTSDRYEYDAADLAVEFVGGPYDGLVEYFEDAEELLSRPVIGALVSRSLISGVQQDSPVIEEETTGLAIYQLELNRKGWRYRFINMARPDCNGVDENWSRENA